MEQDLRFWDGLTEGDGAKGEPGLRLRPRPGVTVRSPGDTAVTALYPVDLALAAGRENLIQALLHRLLTRVGELAGLGHPGYGSRIHLLAGEPDSEEIRRRLKLFIVEALAAEPRIRRDRLAVELEAVSAREPGVLLQARITVEPADGSGPLTFGHSFRL